MEPDTEQMFGFTEGSDVKKSRGEEGKRHFQPPHGASALFRGRGQEFFSKLLDSFCLNLRLLLAKPL
jgi:hypothetical protein